MFTPRHILSIAILAILPALALCFASGFGNSPADASHWSADHQFLKAVSVQDELARDTSPPLAASTIGNRLTTNAGVLPHSSGVATDRLANQDQKALTAESVEQTEHGTKPSPEIVASFDGLGVGFEGPQGTTKVGNPSDNSLAVGPDHIMQTVNSKMAIFTKKGSKFDRDGQGALWPRQHRQRFQGLWRLRRPQQRRRRRPLRPACRPLAGGPSASFGDCRSKRTTHRAKPADRCKSV